MGVPNFCKLLDLILPPTSLPDPFDSILLDAQSLIYRSIDYTFEKTESEIIQEICVTMWDYVEHLLNYLFSFSTALCSEEVTLVLSFDGEGVPMKWGTQRDRRLKNVPNKKSFYKQVLFGNNILSQRIELHLARCLKQYGLFPTRFFKIVLCGCNVPGEGEHKIFQVAEALSKECRRPMVCSIDQDVFTLALLRFRRFETVQIHRYKSFYNVTRMVQSFAPYPIHRLITVSYLFGNDFIPTLVAISPTNAPALHYGLTYDAVEEEDPPFKVAEFLKYVRGHLRMEETAHVDESLLFSFWLTYVWMMDYYTKRTFPQMFLGNSIWDRFDRNQLLTGLLDVTLSRRAFERASQAYSEKTTQPENHPERHVFTDPDILEQLRVYWRESEHSGCQIFRLAKRRPSNTGESTRSRPSGSERFREKTVKI